MSCSDTTFPKRRRQWDRFGGRAMVVTVLVAGCTIAAAIAFHYRVHLFWRYAESRLDLHDIEAVPNSPMPETAVPNGWVRCRVGCMEFSLPPELARNMTSPGHDKSIVLFMHGSRKVIVASHTTNEFSDLLREASELCPTSQQFTLPSFRLACYQASSDDFSWSMTLEEVRWHAFCITMSGLTRLQSGGHTETLFRRDLDGIAHFDGDRASFDWQCKDGMCAGYTHLIDFGEKPDPTWIRAVCQSLRLASGPEMERSQPLRRKEENSSDPFFERNPP